MYPLRGIVIGCNDTELNSLRRGLANMAATVDLEFGDADKAILHTPSLADARCLFLIKVDTPSDLTQVARLNHVFMGKPIVGLMNGDCDVNAVLSTLRAGAAQVVLFPLRNEDFQLALNTITQQFGCPAQASRLIAVSGVSEGCGATTLAINLAKTIASNQQKSCILVELSLRLGRLASYLEIDPPFTTRDLLAGENLDIEMVKQALSRVKDGLHILAGPYRSLDPLAVPAERVVRLCQCLHQLADVIVIDMPYTFDEIYFATMAYADHVVLVAQQSVPSIHALKLVSEAIAKQAVGVKQHVVINRFDGREKELAPSRLKELLQTDVLWTVPNDDRNFQRAANSGRFLLDEAPRSPAWPAIDSLAEALLGLPRRAPAHSLPWVSRVCRLFRQHTDS